MNLPNRYFFTLLAVIVPAFSDNGYSQDSELSAKVLDLFEKQCRECHHPDTDDEYPYLDKNSDISELVEDGWIVPGEPQNSPIYKRVDLDEASKKRMPRSRGAPGDDTYRKSFTAAQKKQLSDWITALSEQNAIEPKQKPKDGTIAQASLPQGQIPDDADLETQARAIFTRSCENCHNPRDEAVPDLKMALHDLTSTEGKSKSISTVIMERVLLPKGEKGRMPRGEDPLPEEEIEILRKWFNSNNDERTKRELITAREVIDTIYEDVNKNESVARYYRYFTLTNLYNVTDAKGFAYHSDREMDIFRAGISKLINSLSLGGTVKVPLALDEEKTVYRIDLRDYKWKAEDWERVVQYYPHGVLGVDSRKEKLINRYTYSRMAWLRADWFTFAAAQPPLYDNIMDYLLGIYEPGDGNIQKRLEDRLGVDRTHNIRMGRAIRAGFHESGVSDHNRLIERHDADYGAYWVSYDFQHRGAGPEQDLRKAPLGPREAYLTDDEYLIFDHDGGEMIYNLPNGLQAYLLATADGRRLKRAPLEIVRSGKGDGTIINGISCMTCHDEGMKAATKLSPKLSDMEDQIRPFIEKSQILGGRELGKFRRLHPEKSELQRVLMLDYERFNEANDIATLGVETGGEPVTKLYEAYYLTRVTSHRLSAGLGIDHDEMMDRLERDSFETDSFRTVYQSLSDGGAEPREQIMQDYLKVVYLLGFHLLPFEPLGYEEFQGEAFAEKIRNDPLFIKLFGPGHDTLKQDLNSLYSNVGEAKKIVVYSNTALNAQANSKVLLGHGGFLSASVTPALRIGDQGVLSLKANRDLNIRILLFEAGGNVTQFFPSKTNPKSLVQFSLANGQPYTFPFRATANIGGETGSEYFRIYISEAEFKHRGTNTYQRKKIYNHRGAVPLAAGFGSAPAASSQKKPARVFETKVGYILKP